MGETSLNVKLIRYTPKPEEIVAMSAKLCYSTANIEELEQGIEAKDQSKFLDKLMDMDHLSPVEHASFTFGIEGVSRSLLAQITRHRIASFSVKSQRYVSEQAQGGETFNYVIPPSIKNLGQEYVDKYNIQMMQIQTWYNEWLEALGNQGENSNQDARFVLPNSTETKIIMTMNARELLHFFSLRCCNRAQWEIRRLAVDMLRQVKSVAPNLFKYAGPGCLRGTCPEGRMTCGKAVEVKKMFESMDCETKKKRS